MELRSDATFQEERLQVLASVRDALRTSRGDPGLRAAAGFLLRHLVAFSHQPPAISVKPRLRRGLRKLTADG